MPRNSAGERELRPVVLIEFLRARHHPEQKPAHRGVRDCIDDLAAMSRGFNQPGLAQRPKVLGDKGLRHSSQHGERSDRARTSAEQSQDPQPRLAGHDPEELRGLGETVLPVHILKRSTSTLLSSNNR